MKTTLMIQPTLSDRLLLAIYNSIEFTDDAVDIYEIAEQMELSTASLDRLIVYLGQQGFIAVQGWEDINLLDKGARYAEHLIETQKLEKRICG